MPRQFTEDNLTDEVVARLKKTKDKRFRELMTSAVKHLHAFAREVNLTEEEWFEGIKFMTAVGQKCDGKRQEFILLSDVLGASMQTITMNNEAYADATEATVLGPFFLEDSPRIELGGDMAAGAHGQLCWVEGTVRDVHGRPVAGARIEVWEADEDGRYDVQYDDGRTCARAHLFTDADGGFRFWGIRPTPYPIPHDGPVGSLLAATGRSPMRASHLHFMVTADGYRRLVTHVFVRDDPYLASDSVFGVRPSLVRDFEEQPAGTPTPDGRQLGDRSWSRARFDIVLAPSAEG